jgi:apolipoprotein N-acyltransferase
MAHTGLARADGPAASERDDDGGRPLVGLHGWLRQLRGWRRLAVAALFGALAVPALPPLYVVPVLVPAFIGFLWLADGAGSRRAAAGVGYAFGLGYFTAGLYWVANALLTRAEEFGWLAPVAPVGLAAILAPFVILPALLCRLGGRGSPGQVLLLAGGWTLAEWLRSWVLTGFPWNLVGSVWAFSPEMLQVTAWLGVYGLSLLTVTAAAMPVVLAGRMPRPGRRWLWPAVPLVLLAACWAGGAVRLDRAGPTAAVATVDGVRLRLVQPNISQSIKWRRDLLDAHLLAQTEMGTAPPAQGEPTPTHVIWSEVAAPLFLLEDPERLALVAGHTPPGGLTMLGTLRRTPAGQPFRLWNSLIAVDGDGGVAGAYDKSHLVPFGEYMPLRSILGIGNFTMGLVDFTAGPGIATLRLPGLPPVSPLICYEAIFPAAVARPDDRPAWLLNLTNDGWYGHSAGPYQHLAAAQLRAVEEGLPLVRVANTGISAVIDPWGRVRTRLGLGERGFIDADLPQPLSRPTVYAGTGNLPVIILAMAAAIAGALMRRDD